MKTQISFWKRMPVALMTVLCCAFVVSSCDKNDDDDTRTDQMYTISGSATGAQVVPAVSTTGTATIAGTYDADSRVLTYTSTWVGLSSAPTSGALYAGASGTNGTMVGSAWTIPSGATASGNVSGSMTLTADQGTQLTAGNWYFVYNTAANAGGEVRGQITATQNP